MKVCRNYSREFKDAVVMKIINRGDRTVLSVCEEVGVPKQTAANWLQLHGKVGANPTPRGRMK